MATVRILLGIICLVVFGQLTEPDGNFLDKGLGLVAFSRLAGRTENRNLATEVQNLGLVAFSRLAGRTENRKLVTEGQGLGLVAFSRLAEQTENRNLATEGQDLGLVAFSRLAGRTENHKLATEVQGLGLSVFSRLAERTENRKLATEWKGLGLGVFSRLAEQTENRKLVTENRKLTTEVQGLAREVILSIARSQIGVREATGKNDGKMVEAYLYYTGNKKGAPWCASFVSWVFGKAGFDAPRTAACSVLFPLALQTTKPRPAVVFGIYFASLKRIGHCGFVEEQKNNWLITIEGNTNVAGAREGDGVYRKIRHKRTIAGYADWQGAKGGAE